jgi:hypothetical protein
MKTAEMTRECSLAVRLHCILLAAREQKQKKADNCNDACDLDHLIAPVRSERTTCSHLDIDPE